MSKYLTLIALYSLVCYPTCADNGTSSVYDLSLEELLNITVISSSKREERKLGAPAIISVITYKEIELLGFSSLRQIIEYATGVSTVNGEGNTFRTVTVMGNTQVNYNTNTLLLFDGHPILSPYHGSFDFAAIPLSSIARIEIVKGANSVLYGTNAINAVINVISKKKSNETYEPTVIASYGSGNRYSLRGSFTDPNNKFAIYADISDIGGERLNLQDESGRHVSHDPSEKLHSLNFQSSIETINLQLLYSTREQENYRTKGFVDRQNNKEGNTVVTLEQRIPLLEGQNLSWSFQYSDWFLDKDFFEFSTGEKYRWEYQSVFKLLIMEYDLTRRDSFLIAGLSFSEMSASRFKQNINQFDIGKFGEETTNYSIYLNGMTEVANKFDFHYGIRRYASQFYDGVNKKKVNLKNISLRAAGIYHLKNNRSLRLTFAEAFRVPTYFEKQVNSATVRGNANLSPEESQTFSLIYSQEATNYNFDLSFFQNTIDGRISRIPAENEPGIFENKNLDSITYRGVEAEFKYKYENLYGFSGLSYNHANEMKVNVFIYKWMLSGGLGLHINENLLLDFSYKYRSQWEDAPSASLVNAHISYQFNKNTGIRIGVNNLFDDEYLVPEIARNQTSVPYIPTAEERHFTIEFKTSY